MQLLFQDPAGAPSKHKDSVVWWHTLGYRAAAQVRAMLSPGHFSQDFYTSTTSADTVFCSRPRPAEAWPGQTGQVPLACWCCCEQLPCPHGTGCDIFMQLAQVKPRCLASKHLFLFCLHLLLPTGFPLESNSLGFSECLLHFHYLEAGLWAHSLQSMSCNCV